MWLGIMLLCYDASALSCQVVAKSEPFYSEQACLKEAEEFANTLLAQGVMAIPHCHKIKGDSV